MKYIAIIPAYNEEKCIFNVVKSIKLNNSNIDVLVINDGSTDNTYSEALRAGAKIINLSCNLGIGGAVQTGYIYALYNNYDIAIQIDGDGQHNAKDLNKLINEIKFKNLDMVIGSRFIRSTDYKPSPFRQLGIIYFSKLVSFLCKSPYFDTTSGYRAVNKKMIKLFANYYPKDYPEVETILLANKHNMIVKEIPVDMDERQGGKSSITPLKSIYYMFKVTLSLILQPRIKEVL
ncbi:hypothetical protein BD780_002927 [Clostridium tetanomorphum]|uniref:Glycosyltransferase family 2 protein n=1 Tax=Clostridium tetanomorphum TaxID=1553 RepID=A0A923IZD6_CLOTT|nr:glycosyltransferase family 2 protein [Clostridium tetanomorphum]KAJ53730.1 glycosyl transferase family protein [Clostridium tetanomorphum DSM 665]MBC2397241.1 glycosyltransferase family 2 protein [Clostridium tetanomorphum]MBP1862458.1 glycosyltransferase involved in cell wall biosynthesis [Clostridium tetanomorphum]NRS85702.1 hypothetical protein [Clostridium tetanomorphum]NRZ96288.1 hypothetical protein [Clostridium tetanomorphum]